MVAAIRLEWVAAFVGIRTETVDGVAEVVNPAAETGLKKEMPADAGCGARLFRRGYRNVVADSLRPAGGRDRSGAALAARFCSSCG
jgi:hypothetical protein